MVQALRSFAHHSRLFKRVGFGCIGLSFWLTSACQTSCGTNNTKDPVRYADGTTRAANGLQIYESTPLHGEWLDFPGSRTFRFMHNLGTTDIKLTLYIAFSSNPMSGDAGDVAFATGDVAVVDRITPCSIDIRNNTCSEQFLYVNITAPPADADAGTCE